MTDRVDKPEWQERGIDNNLTVTGAWPHASSNRVRCPKCRGKGQVPLSAMCWSQSCSECGGAGVVDAIPNSAATERCVNTIHSNYVTDHRCQLPKGHDGDCLFGRATRNRVRPALLTCDECEGRKEDCNCG